MYERFSDRARRVMQLANQAAQQYGHEFIDTRHLFLGLLREASGMACKAILDTASSGALDRLLVTVTSDLTASRGPKKFTMGALPQTPSVKLAIERAIAEAREMKNNYIGTEHLLLGLLHQHDTSVYLRLAAEGVTHEKVVKWLMDFAAEQLKASVAKQEQQSASPSDDDDPLYNSFYAVLDSIVKREIAVALEKERKELRTELEQSGVTIPPLVLFRLTTPGSMAVKKAGQWTVTCTLGTPVEKTDGQ